MRAIVVAIVGFVTVLAGAGGAAAQSRAPAPIVAPTGPLIPELMGRWDLAFRSPQASLDTVWVVERSAEGSTSLGTVGNNPVGLAVTDARLRRGRDSPDRDDDLWRSVYNGTARR